MKSKNNRIIESERCKCGYECEDINHLIFECVNYDEERTRMSELLEERKVRQPYCVWEWVQQTNLVALSAMYIFLKKINRII